MYVYMYVYILLFLELFIIKICNFFYRIYNIYTIYVSDMYTYQNFNYSN